MKQKAKKQHLIAVHLTRDELCIIQQALGLRKHTLINTVDLTSQEGIQNRVLAETRKVHEIVQGAIKEITYQEKDRPRCKTCGHLNCYHEVTLTKDDF